MIYGLQIKTFKFVDATCDCDYIDAKVNKFLKNITENSGTIQDITPLINDDGYTVFITVKYVCSELESKSKLYKLDEIEVDTLFNALIFARDVNGREYEGDFDTTILDNLIGKFANF